MSHRSTGRIGAAGAGGHGADHAPATAAGPAFNEGPLAAHASVRRNGFRVTIAKQPTDVGERHRVVAAATCAMVRRRRPSPAVCTARPNRSPASSARPSCARSSPAPTLATRESLIWRGLLAEAVSRDDAGGHPRQTFHSLPPHTCRVARDGPNPPAWLGTATKGVRTGWSPTRGEYFPCRYPYASGRKRHTSCLRG